MSRYTVAYYAVLGWLVITGCSDSTSPARRRDAAQSASPGLAVPQEVWLRVGTVVPVGCEFRKLWPP